MKFTLTYEGELPSGGNSSRKAKKKWEIRNVFHPQLVELAGNHRTLRRALRGSIIPTNTDFGMTQRHHSDPLENEELESSNDGSRRDLYESIDIQGKRFLPIVRESMALTCGLKITFLRKEEPGGLISQGGDLDNRIKVLFDALRMPSESELNNNVPEYDPMYCLLEDDSLITSFNVQTDRFLSNPNSSVHTVFLMIEVDVRVTQAALYNLWCLGD